MHFAACILLHAKRASGPAGQRTSTHPPQSISPDQAATAARIRGRAPPSRHPTTSPIPSSPRPCWVINRHSTPHAFQAAQKARERQAVADQQVRGRCGGKRWGPAPLSGLGRWMPGWGGNHPPPYRQCGDNGPRHATALLTPHLCQVVRVVQEKQAAAERMVADLRAELERMRAPSAGHGVVQVGGWCSTGKQVGCVRDVCGSCVKA